MVHDEDSGSVKRCIMMRSIKEKEEGRYTFAALLDMLLLPL